MSLRKRKCLHCDEVLDESSESEYCYRHRKQYECTMCGQESLLPLRAFKGRKVCDECKND